MVEKHKHEMVETQVMLESLAPPIKWEETDGTCFAQCSMHGHHNMQQDCLTCRQIDQMIQDGSLIVTNDEEAR